MSGVGDRCYCVENSLFTSIHSLFGPVGNSTANPLWILASSVCDWSDFNEFPFIFRIIREFDLLRRVRPSLPAQPPRRGLLGSP